MEGKTHFERVIGGSEEEKHEAREELQRRFEARDNQFARYEIAKSPEDVELIQKMELLVDETVERYGGEAKPLPLDHIYVLSQGAIGEMTNGSLFGGLHRPFQQKIGVEKRDSKFLFASGLAHELFHLKSAKAARVGKSAQDVRLYRTGLSMLDRKDPLDEWGKEKEYFGILEEAIVAESTRRLMLKIGKSGELFGEEYQAMQKIREWITAHYRSGGVPEDKINEFKEELKHIPNPQEKVEIILEYTDDEAVRGAFAAGMFDALHAKGKIELTERYTERKLLNELLDTVVASSNGEFPNRDAAFDAFARANFSGNYIPLARSIEKHLGKGSFRKLAETFSVKP